MHDDVNYKYINSNRNNIENKNNDNRTTMTTTKATTKTKTTREKDVKTDFSDIILDRNHVSVEKSPIIPKVLAAISLDLAPDHNNGLTSNMDVPAVSDEIYTTSVIDIHSPVAIVADIEGKYDSGTRARCIDDRDDNNDVNDDSYVCFLIICIVYLLYSYISIYRGKCSKP
jgi:hypothetical protein